MIKGEQFAAKHLGALLDETCQVEVVGTATHGDTGIQLCRELRPEAVFLDINLSGKDGVLLANQLRTLPQPPRLVFTTSDRNRAVDAFRLEAVDYLLKPLDPFNVLEAVNRLAAVLRPSKLKRCGLILVQKVDRPPKVNRALERRLLSCCRLEIPTVIRFGCCPVGKSSPYFGKAGTRGSIRFGKSLLPAIP